MREKELYGYTKREWLRIVLCYMLFFFNGGLEASEGVFYTLMKEELQVPYTVQGALVSMSSWSYIIGSPIIGYIMTKVNVKPVILSAFVAYLVGHVVLYNIKTIWLVFIALFVEGLGGVFLDVGINTWSTIMFQKHRGVMMNYLHFFYGLGSSFGPYYASFFMNLMKIGYRGIFLGLIIPSSIGFIATWFSKISLTQEKNKELPVEKANDLTEKVEASSELSVEKASESTVKVENSSEFPKESIWKNFLSPLVWLLGLNMGAVYAIETITVNWSGLYFKELYNITTEQVATFVSLFFAFYTVARLVTGYIIDYLGDTKSVILFNCILIVFYVVCFVIGRPAMWVLSFSGFLISPFYPTAITVPMEVLGKRAGNAISVILCIGLIINWFIQMIIGYVNEYIGSQWGFRILSITMCLVMIICMMFIQCLTKKQNSK